MTAQINPILLQLILNQGSLNSCFPSISESNLLNYQLQSFLPDQLNIALQNHLVQTVLQEKLKN
jgi:hypothetical protein